MIGRSIGHYRLLRQLGHGGMGAVYLGRRQDGELYMDVAVKLVHERLSSGEMHDRFRRERQLLANLKHPHIAMLLDAGSTREGYPYFIMEHIEGRTIDTWCREKKPSLSQLLGLFRKVVAAVGLAHDKGVVHRDLKPGNMMVTEVDEPKLLDFGIAHLSGEDALTRAGEVLMTPEYAAPEQFRGLQVTPACDIYALGLILMELISGQRPSHWGCGHLDAVTELMTLGRSGSSPDEEQPVTPRVEDLMKTAITPPPVRRHPAAITPPPVRRQSAAITPPTVLPLPDTVPDTIQSGTARTAMISAGPCTETETLPRAAGKGSLHEVVTTRLDEVPEALGHVLRTALADRPQFRYASTARLIEDIDRVLAALHEEHPPHNLQEKFFDVIVWYHPVDRLQVAGISRGLESHGLRVWMDTRALQPGADPVREMGAALERSFTCLMILGPGGGAPWLVDSVTRDRLAFRADNLNILPVLLPAAAYPDKQSLLPSFLRGRAWLDLKDSPEETGLDRLARTIKNKRLEDRTQLTPTGVCPFRGLEVFREADRDYFFGREGTSQRILQHLLEHGFIGVLGPSGSGKSSVVRAGVIPHLAENGLTSLLMTPTTHPLEELAFQLNHFYRLQGRSMTPELLVNRLRTSNEALHFIARELFDQTPGKKLCLVIDQFEELFTLARDDFARHRFVDLVCHALDQGEGKLAVLLTLRSDFLGKNVVFPHLDSYILDHSIQVLPMVREDLARAVAEPARLAGLRPEPGLLDRILDDVAGASGELPLLEHALLELYERREGGLLTFHAYEAIGGIDGALARRAESEYAALDPQDRHTLRKMFTLCLVHPGEGVEDTRRRATRAELRTVGPSSKKAEVLLDRWMKARLLTGSRDDRGKGEMVDVAHEALIRKWERIRTWMSEDRETARLLGRLRQEALAWHDAKRTSDHLPRGAPLLQMKDLVERESAHLGPLEKAFVAAGMRQARLRKNLAVLVGCLGFVLAAIAFAMFFSARSARQAAFLAKGKAEQRNREGNYNLAMMFDEKAGRALAEQRPHEALIYVTAALAREIPAGETLPGPVGRFADPRLSEAGRLLWTSPVATPAHRVSVNPAGTIMAMAGTDHVIRLVDLGSGSPLGALTGHTNRIEDLAFSPDGLRLASASADRDLRIWRLPANRGDETEAPLVISAHRGSVTGVAFAPDGETLASASRDGTVRLWAVPSGKALAEWTVGDKPTHGLSFSQDGKWLAYGFVGRAIGIIEMGSGRIERLDMSCRVRDICFVSNYLVAACDNGRLLLVDPQRGRRLRTLRGHESPVIAIGATPRARLVSLGLDGRMVMHDPAAPGPDHQWTAFDVPDPEDEEDGYDPEDQNDDEDKDEAGEDEDENEDWDPGSTSLGDLAMGGKFLVAVMDGGFPKCWDLSTRVEVAVMSGHSFEVLGAAFSPDGKILASASEDSTIRLWSLVGDGKPPVARSTLSGHEDEVQDVAFSPDGSLLASASSDETIRLWTLAGSGAAEAVILEGHEDEVNGVAFSPDGLLLASAGKDGTVRLWSPGVDVPQEERLLLILRGHEDEAVKLVFSPDGRLLASAGNDRTVRIWSVSRGGKGTVAARAPTVLRGHGSNVVSVAFSPDGRLLASGSDDQTIRLWDVAARRTLRTLFGHASDVAGLAFLPDGKTLVSASDDQTIKLWDVATGQTRTTLSGHGAPVVGLALSPDGRLLASASEDRTVRLWDVTGKERISILKGHQAALTGAAISPDGKLAASASEDRTVKLWDLATGEITDTLSGHGKDVSSVIFSPDGRLVITCSDDGTLRISPLGSLELVSVIRAHDEEVIDVAVSPDGRLLATASDDRTLKIWDLQTQEALATLSGHESDVISVAFSPDGRLLASGSNDHDVRLWASTGAGSDAAGDWEQLVVLSGHSAEVTAVAFSPDNRFLASASLDHTVKLWDVANGREAATTSGHGKWVLDVTFSPDGRILASSDSGGTVLLWQMENDRKSDPALTPMATLVGHEGEVNGLAFSPLDGSLVSASSDKTLRLWHPEDLKIFAHKGEGSVRGARFFRRTLDHFGYRLDGSRVVLDPGFALEPLGDFRFPKSSRNPVRHGSASLISWLADE